MNTFADDLHELCKREMQHAIACENTAAAMTTELVRQLSSTIALLTCGNSIAWQATIRHITEALPTMTAEKAAVVRREFDEMQREVRP